MSGQGKGATHGDLASAGFTGQGIQKNSVASGMMSHADTTSHGKGIVSGLQSSGARGQGIGGSAPSRGALNDAGLMPSGVQRGSPGAHMQSSVDKSGTGGGMKASLQSRGAMN